MNDKDLITAVWPNVAIELTETDWLTEDKSKKTQYGIDFDGFRVAYPTDDRSENTEWDTETFERLHETYDIQINVSGYYTSCGTWEAEVRLFERGKVNPEKGTYDEACTVIYYRGEITARKERDRDGDEETVYTVAEDRETPVNHVFGEIYHN